MTYPDGVSGRWLSTTLGEIGEYLNGRGFKKSEWSERGRMIIRIQDLTGTGNAPNYFAGDCDDKHVVRDGDLLISWAATLDAFIWNGPEAVLNQHIFKVRSKIDHRFHYYLVKHVMSDLQRRAHGSGMVHITKRQFEETPVFIPTSAAEQRRIVIALEEQMTKLEAGVAEIDAAAARLRRYKSRALSAAIEDRADWPVEQLGDVVLSMRNGLSHKPEGHDGVRILRISAVRPMAVDLEDVRYLDRDKADERFLIQTDDLIFTRYNGNPELVGVCGRVRDVYEPTLHPDKLIRAQVDDARANPAYLEIALNTGVARQHIRRSTKTTAGQAGIAGSDLKKTPVPLPPLWHQERIAAIVHSRLGVAAEVERSIITARRRADRLGQALLAAAFAGRLGKVA